MLPVDTCNVSELSTEMSCHNVSNDSVDEKCGLVSCDSSLTSDIGTSNVEPSIELESERSENTLFRATFR